MTVQHGRKQQTRALGSAAGWALVLLMMTTGALSAQTPMPGAPNSVQLPEGVSQVYALRGNNSLVVHATPEGYAQIRELVRNLDGDLDIIRTEVRRVDTSPEALKALGITGRTGTFAPAEAARLADAVQHGRLKSWGAIRVTTREDTVVDALLSPDARPPRPAPSLAAMPLTFVPRLGLAGSVRLEIMQPVSNVCVVKSGETAVIALESASAQPGAPVSLLLITPTLLPSNFRPARQGR